jgi:hypothetical protein
MLYYNITCHYILLQNEIKRKTNLKLNFNYNLKKKHK